MTDTEKKQAAGPQVMLRGLLVVVALAVLAGGGLFVYQKARAPEAEGPAQVAMLDSEAIYALPEFTQVKKELEAFEKELLAKLEKAAKDKTIKTPQEAENLRIQMRQQLQMEQLKRLKPLQERVTAAIAAIASQRKYRVVLDKKIVVTGVVDITEDVKKQFAQTKTGDAPKPNTSEAESHVGFINEEVINELRVFKDANAKLVALYEKLGQDFQKKAAKLSPADKEKLRTEVARQFQEAQVEIFKPINENVNDVITQVAKDKGLSLVLNSNHVLWGGRNLTDDVIKKLVQAKS